MILAAAVIAMAFATGFTCSKNSPEQAAPATSAPEQEQMAAPTTVEGAPAGDAAATPTTH